MKDNTRRALLAGAASLAAGTVAAASLLRKPAGPEIATLVSSPLAGDTGNLKLIQPPRPLAPATFFTAEGAEQSVADYAGRGLVINLWATWCAPCVAEMPALQAMAKILAGEKILVLPLSSDRGGAAVVQRFYDAHGIVGLPVLLDPKGDAARAWGSRGLPTTIIVDRTGQERGRLEGAAEWAAADMVAAVRGLVG